MKIQPRYKHVVPVIIGGNNNTNSLGVVRNLGRQGIPVILLDFDHRSMVRSSRYVSKKLACPSPKESEDRFIEFLLQLGRQADQKSVIIPTNDAEVMALSKHKADLDQYYLLPIPSYDIIQKLVDKRFFYQMLEQMGIPHPKTFFPSDLTRLESMARELEFPFLIKPACMHLFFAEFHTKCFVINSTEDLNLALRKIKGKDLDLMLQDIIPGSEIYMLYTYFNKKVEPVAICGYDKQRQYPPDFGNGSSCRTRWRSEPIESAMKVLKGLKYRGMAEPEFKKDPRDGEYKFLEINARTTTQSILPAACGMNIEYLAYLDSIGEEYPADFGTHEEGSLWVDEIADLLSCLSHIRRGTLSTAEAIRSYRGKKVYATAAWDDPVPFLQFLYDFAGQRVNNFCEKNPRG